MQFEWDVSKDKANLWKHGVSFAESQSVFYDPLAKTIYDPDHSQSEDRWITIGYSNKGHLLIVCHVDRQDIIRIISARPATKTETKRHEKETGRRP